MRDKLTKVVTEFDFLYIKAMDFIRKTCSSSSPETAEQDKRKIDELLSLLDEDKRGQLLKFKADLEQGSSNQPNTNNRLFSGNKFRIESSEVSKGAYGL